MFYTGTTSAGDGVFADLETYSWRVAQIYPNPNHIIDARRPEQSTPYHVRHTWANAMRTTQQVSYSSPGYGDLQLNWKMNMLYPSTKNVGANYGTATGSAPTSGVFTGVPSGCGPSGIHGGNPYS